MKGRNIASTNSMINIMSVLFCMLVMISCGGKDKEASSDDTATVVQDNTIAPGDTSRQAVGSGKAPQNASRRHTGPMLPDSDPLNEQLMREQALSGNTEMVRQLLMQGTDPEAIDEEGHTALMLAAYNGHAEIVTLFIERGVEINTRDAAGRTALMYASTGPFPETVKILLEQKAEPNLADHAEHFTPLMHAAAEGQLAVVKILLEYGADPGLTDIDGDTAASFARQNGHAEVVAYLESHTD